MSADLIGLRNRSKLNGYLIFLISFHMKILRARDGLQKKSILNVQHFKANSTS